MSTNFDKVSFPKQALRNFVSLTKAAGNGAPTSVQMAAFYEADETCPVTGKICEDKRSSCTSHCWLKF